MLIDAVNYVGVTIFGGSMSSLHITGNLVDITDRSIRPVEIHVAEGRIVHIADHSGPTEGYLIPGFVDAHVHVESSMLLPSEFARLAVTHGTVATISDPHEIANVLGIEGVDFMITNGKKVPFHFFFGAPSCVPATTFETAGDAIDSDAVGRLLQRPEVRYLSEMMNFPGVLHGDPEVLKKIAHAHRLGKPVDGHAPGLRGDDVMRYASAGISTDHECFTHEEALDKLAAGMWVQIREGSAAKNFEALWPLLRSHPDRVMLCSDDKHPDGLVDGHINTLCARAVALGVDVFDVLRAACLNPIAHYRLPVGRLHVGDPADFIVVRDLVDFKVDRTFIQGRLVAEHGRSLIDRVPASTPNNSRVRRRALQTLPNVHGPGPNGDRALRRATDHRQGSDAGQAREWTIRSRRGSGLLKIAVVNRYMDARSR
jgi:adenine deaminase